jgi:hypothetical protein
MKSTDNKKPPIRINSVVFAIFWALSYVIGAAAAYFLALTLFVTESPLQPSAWYILGAQFTFLTTMGMVSGSIQRFAVWLRFGRRLMWWRRATVTGWWLGGLVQFGVSPIFYYLYNYWDTIAFVLTIATPLIVMQWLALRQQVDRAGFYVLVSLAVAVVFASSLFASSNINFIGGSLAFGGPALVTAYTLIWLFSMSGKITRKQKTVPDTSRLTTPDAAEQDTNSSLYSETPSELSEKLD